MRFYFSFNRRTKFSNSILVEKQLILGFSIFTITVFLSIFFPFLITVSQWQVKIPEFEKYNNLINKIDYGIQFTINNSDSSYLSTISYLEGLDCVFKGYIAQFDYKIDGQSYQRIIEYKDQFIYKSFINFPSGNYLLNISYFKFKLNIRLIKL